MNDNAKLEQLINMILSYNPGADIALRGACVCNKRMLPKRKSGRAFIVHRSVAIMLAEMKWIATIIAGMLHDVIEDTSATFEELSLNSVMK